MSQPGLVLDRIEDSIDGGLEWIEAGVYSVDLNGAPGGARLRLFLEAILLPILSSFGEQSVAWSSLPRSLAWEVDSSSIASFLPAERTSGLEIRYHASW